MPVLDRVKKMFGSQLRRNVATGVGTSCLSAALALISYPIYLHFLGYERYGVWLALSTILTFAQLGNFGINPAISKLVAEAHGLKDMHRVQRYLTTALMAVCTSGAIVFTAVVLLRHPILAIFRVSGRDAQIMSDLLPWIALLSLYIFIVECLNATLVGLGRMDLENYFRTVSQATALVCSALLLHIGYGVRGLLLGSAASYIVMHLMSLCAIRVLTKVPLLHITGFTLNDLARLLNLGGWVFGGSLVSMALSPVNRVILSRYAGMAALPVYEIAFGSSLKVRSLLESGFRAMLPEISRISAPVTQETLRRASALERRGFRIMAGLGGPVYTVVIIFATLLLHLWLRSQYQAALPVAFRIMLVGSFLSLLSVPGYYILLGLGRARDCFVSSAILGAASLVVIGLIVLVTSTISVSGISVGVATGMGLCSAYILWKVRNLSTTLPRAPVASQEVASAHGLSDSGPNDAAVETEFGVIS